MSGIKRKIEDKDPDYEDISQVQENKRHKVVEQNAREATVQKIEVIIKNQFSLEMKNKEHEIEVIGQRLNEARRMMDKLRACIVANYYANAGMPKIQEASKSDPAVLNHPAIRRFLESPSRSSSPLNQGSDAHSLGPSEAESLSQQGEGPDKDLEGAWREDGGRQERRPGRNTGKDTFGVPSSVVGEQRVTYHTTSDQASRLYIKKTIVVGNVSKYIPPDKREENDQSTHKWMVYVRGSRREPSIDHFVKKVWFFLHPSYKPNDLVEVSEPPFHLTRRGWGEFPVRIQIHFKDPRNKRIDIIHHLKVTFYIDYNCIKTRDARFTVVDVELHRNSLGDDYAPFPSSSHSHHNRAASPMPPSPLPQTPGLLPDRCSSPLPLSQDSHPTMAEKGEIHRRVSGLYIAPLTASERAPSRPKVTEKILLGSHGNSAFQPITASCKIIPQGQAPSPSESPGKSFQPITMSCKIVSGSPISTPSHSPLPRTPTSTPIHTKQGSSMLNNPYIIVDKPSQVIGMTTTSAYAGSPSAKQSGVTQGTRSPAPKVPTGSFLSSGIKVSSPGHSSLSDVAHAACPLYNVLSLCRFLLQVIIKQEPGEVPTQQHQMVSTVTAAQQPATQQFVAVKGGHVISMSPQKQTAGASGTGATPSKVLGIPVSSALQAAVKQVAISSGQILVAKGNPSVSKVMGGKQVVAQGVAKAIVSGGAGSIVGQQVIAKATGVAGGTGKSGGKVMATLQLPANNLANLANLPPGTKLYLTTNSKNPSGKGKLLLIPQGAILRASNSSGNTASHTGHYPPNSSGITTSHTGHYPTNSSGNTGTFLVGQPASQSVGKHGATGSASNVVSSPAAVTQQAIRVTAGQKAAILAQALGGSQASQVKLSDGTVKMVTTATAAHLSKPGTTTLRMTGGVITATSSTPSAVTIPAATATVSHQVSGRSLENSGLPSPKDPGKCNLLSKCYPVFWYLQGMLKIHSGASSSQQTVLTIPTNQLKQLGVGTATGGLQTILMPVGKGKSGDDAVIKYTISISPSENDSKHTEHIETLMQLLTAVVKKFPLIVPEKTEDSHPFCAVSTEQYYSWNIGKRRAAEVSCPVGNEHWPGLCSWYARPEEGSMEDILTQIDNEPECPSTLGSCEELVQRLEQLQTLLKTEPEDHDDEVLDIISVTPPSQRLKVKEEEQEDDPEPKYFLAPEPATQFISDTAQQIGVSFQQVEVVKNVFAPVMEAMILKATEQFASDILREALAGAHVRSSQNRPPREITAMNIHQAICAIPTCDFLTNTHMGYLTKED
uniref:YEATS domain-containing protein 2 n=1 Tax=Esox lucius TaxID=8010 RepID=A0A6Q2XXX9_ESOLU